MYELRKWLMVMSVIGAVVTIVKIALSQYETFGVGMKPQKFRCPHAHVITVQEGGRLGNGIWEYWSLLAIIDLYKNKFDFVASISWKLRSKINFIFERITNMTTTRVPSYCLDLDPYVLPLGGNLQEEKLFNNTRPLILAKYSARYEDIYRYGFDNIRKQFRFHKKYLNFAHKQLRKIKSKFNNVSKDVSFVSLHYRGEDYLKFLKRNYKNFSSPPNASYYLKAMDYFDSLHHPVIFILTTIDKAWLSENLPLLSKKNRLLVINTARDVLKDLALMSICNHSVISYGTFGTTAALFAGGTTFVYDLNIPVDSRGSTLAMGMTEVLPNWHLLN